jgi:formylglycine-generating enzyme required for sulfatase activity
MAASGCDSQRELPPLPEVLVVVDTNLPVTLAASRLRIDLFTADGTWFESSDVARPTTADWPASFSVFSEDESRVKPVWIRLRAYAEGRQTDYRGERFRDWDAPFADAPGDGTPRLFKEGVDVTPSTEPAPLLTVDRLLLVHLTPEERGSVRVVLDAACVGTMSRLGPRGVPEDGAETCIDQPKARVAVQRSALDPDMSLGGASAAGTYALDPCASGESTDERVCVEGGGTILGTNGLSDYTPGAGAALAPSPARFFAVGKFLIDKDEVTVGRYRKAVGLSWKGPLPAPNEGPLAPSSNDPNGNCTWSDVKLDRESYALNCIDWEAARIFCQAEGGDLPTELQWEHAATVAGRRAKTRYPWGDELPTCDRAVFGRTAATPPPVSCVTKGIGTVPYSQNAGDVSFIGVVAQGGGLFEWVLDDAQPYTAPCWIAADAKDARCFTPAATSRIVRGGSWASPPARGTFRFVATTLDAGAGLGFRCVYPVAAR